MIALMVSYCCDSKGKFEHVNGLLESGHTFMAFVSFVIIQSVFASIAAIFVWIEPIAAGRHHNPPSFACSLCWPCSPRICVQVLESLKSNAI